MNIVSLILGIAAMILSLMAPCSCGQIEASDYMLVFALSAAAIILGILGIKKAKEAGLNDKRGMIGMILGIAAVVILIVITIVLILFMLVIFIQTGVFEDMISSFR